LLDNPRGQRKSKTVDKLSASPKCVHENEIKRF
jgi:hypothetical protein